MTSITLLGIAGSLRRASTNRGLLRAAQAQLPADAPVPHAEDRSWWMPDAGCRQCRVVLLKS